MCKYGSLDTGAMAAQRNVAIVAAVTAITEELQQTRMLKQRRVGNIPFQHLQLNPLVEACYYSSLNPIFAQN